MRWRNPPFRKVTLSARSVANIIAVRGIRSVFETGDGEGAGKTPPRSDQNRLVPKGSERETSYTQVAQPVSLVGNPSPLVACLASLATSGPQSPALLADNNLIIT